MSFKISSVLSKVEPEPNLHTGSGSDQKVPAPTGSGSTTLYRYRSVGTAIYENVNNIFKVGTGTVRYPFPTG